MHADCTLWILFLRPGFTRIANLPMAMKRQLDEGSDAHNFSTMAVYSYQGPIVTLFVPPEDSQRATHPVLDCLFGPRKHAMFSVTRAFSAGAFLVFDEGVAEGFLGRAATPSERWRCLYIHENSEERDGSEVSGCLTALCAKLTAAAVPVLNVCTLARNFMLVRDECSERALSTLRAAVVGSQSGTAEPAPATPTPSAKDVRLRLMRSHLAICSLQVDQLQSCTHALLQLLLFMDDAPKSFFHLFEMGGEASLMFEQVGAWVGGEEADGMRWVAMRCDAMRCDAMRCDAMRSDRIRGFTTDYLPQAMLDQLANTASASSAALRAVIDVRHQIPPDPHQISP